jgi:hypothetical protein
MSKLGRRIWKENLYPFLSPNLSKVCKPIGKTLVAWSIALACMLHFNHANWKKKNFHSQMFVHMTNWPQPNWKKPSHHLLACWIGKRKTPLFFIVEVSLFASPFAHLLNRKKIIISFHYFENTCLSHTHF